MKFLKIFIIIVGTFLFSQTTIAQENIEKSEIIKTINNKQYYIHTVKKNHTIYSICKIYGVTEKELALDNPEIFDGLQLNQELKIKKKYDKPAISNDFIYHKVKRKETVYSITKQYKISQIEFYKYNPEAKQGLKKGQEVRIRKKVKINHEVQMTDVKYLKHKVRKRETLYSLSKKYHISQDNIVKANPKIKESGLNKGDVINIPTKRFVNNTLWQKQDTVKQVVDTLKMEESTVAFDCIETEFDKMQVLKIGLLLPFNLDMKSLNNELNKIETNVKIRPKTKPFFEIYQGILLGLQDLKLKGYNIDLYAFDTKKSNFTVKAILAKPEVQNLDFIIGPIYKNLFDTALKYKPKQIPIINPIIDVYSERNVNFNYVQTQSSESIVSDSIINYISNFDTVNYIIVSDGSILNIDIVDNYKQKLIQKKQGDSTIVKLVNFDKKIDFSKYFKKGYVNYVIVPSNNEAFVTNVITKLNTASKEDSVILFGFNSWEKFKIQTKYLHQLNLTYFTNMYVDYNSDVVINFNKKYREEYNSEASKYSYIGFDILNVFTGAYFKYTNGLLNCLQHFEYKGLMYNFKFLKQKACYVNEGLHLVQYKKNLTVKTLN